MIAMVMVSLLMMMKQKKNKKGVDDNPDVGYRYWGDAMHALATYSPRTSAVWFNRIFQSGEEYTQHFHMSVADAFGEQMNIGDLPVNTLATTAFMTTPPTPTSWEMDAPLINRTNRIPHFTRQQGDNPQYPTHNNGAVMLHCNQAYMGLNAATLQSYLGVVSSIPGTITHLMSVGPQYGMHLWVRWRDTVDLGPTVGINPVAIIADIMLDQHPVSKINWASFAYVGKRLIEESPFMWFSVALGMMTQQDAVQYILTRARLAQKRMPDGTIGLKLIGEIPEGGPAAMVVIDAMRDLEEFTFEKDSNDEAEVVNEFRGSYMAARYNTDFSDNAQFEGHLLEADMHVVNTGNIILSGVRKQNTQELDFLSWPDDAKAYLWEVLARVERPYLRGTATGGMYFTRFAVGDSVRIRVYDASLGMNFDRVFEIQETAISGYPDEKVSLTLKESHAYYGLMEYCIQEEAGGGDSGLTPNSNPQGGWDTGQQPVPIPVVLDMLPMVAMLGSVHLNGAPGVYLTTTGALDDQLTAETYIVANCSPETPALEEEPVATEQSVFPLHATLMQPVHIQAMYPGFMNGDEIIAKVWVPEKVTSLRPLWQTINANCRNLDGVQSLLFSAADNLKVNYIMMSTATVTNPAGRAVLVRAVSIIPFTVDNDIFLRIQGLYAVDGPVDLNLQGGSVIAILPPTNSMTDYEWTAAPLPTCYGQTAQIGGSRVNMRTVVGSSRGKLPWPECYCASYQLDDYYMQSPVPCVYGVNNSSPPFLPSTEGIRVTSLADQFTFLISAADLTHIYENNDMYGIAQPASADLDITTSLDNIPITRTAEGRKSGVAYIEVAVSVRNGGGTELWGSQLSANKINFTSSLADMGINVPLGTHLYIGFTIIYRLRTLTLDEPTTLRSTYVGDLSITYESQL